jgi:hypothetical protein
MRIRKVALPLIAGMGLIAAGLAVSGRVVEEREGSTTATAAATAPTNNRAAAGSMLLLPAADPDNVGIVFDAPQNVPYYEYDSRLTFIRLRQLDFGGGGMRGYGRRGRDPGWAHDYPSAEHNLSKIIQELTFIQVRVEDWGGNILTLDDPRLMQFPVAYMSEPGQWRITPEEIEGLREYLLKGGFIIFDDFGGGYSGDMYNLADQMAQVMPDLQWVRLDATADIFDSFFQIDPDNLQLASSSASYRGVPVFYGLYEDNDPDARLIAIGADGGDFGEFWEFSDRGYYPVDISNEAYKVGINYLVYAMTH